MLRSAAFASSVVASTPSALPFTRPLFASKLTIQANTSRWVSAAIRRRLCEIVEWSGVGWFSS
jgi:hypothetical protein